MTERFSRIAITLPPEDLAAADQLAKVMDRSRSWVVAEAIRQYVAARSNQGAPLDRSRAVQLQRDLGLTAEERIRASEDIVPVPVLANRMPDMPRTFATYDEFVAWRRDRVDR